MTDPIETKLEEILARADAATAGPWKMDIRHEDRIGVSGAFGMLAITGSNSPAAQTDADFIAHARTDVPALAQVAHKALELALAMASTNYAWSSSDLHKTAAKLQVDIAEILAQKD